eukprot:comp19372_c0_seq1/m.22329 comp19372_c0_seq1/g.22329  ORF comp19372_c0_seq1/g.22329 comp19372_c0_seq1/m.22329 type:complete len:223 (-) comp19372_c0_seq1:135-803(-)
MGMLERFDVCLCNYYPDGSSNIGWHADDERDLVRGAPIASISLGAERYFDLRSKHPISTGRGPAKVINHRMTVQDGCLLLMAGDTQINYKHAVPIQKKVPNGRINLTFRCIDNSRISRLPQIKPPTPVKSEINPDQNPPKPTENAHDDPEKAKHSVSLREKLHERPEKAGDFEDVPKGLRGADAKKRPAEGLGRPQGGPEGKDGGSKGTKRMRQTTIAQCLY